MNRRTTLKVLAGGAAVLAVAPLIAGNRGATLALAPWSGPPPDEHDVRLLALSYAVLAPNAHNTQPWKIGLRDDAIDLFVDATRLLPATDPPYRQTHVSQGTFLELLVIALAEHGVIGDVTYFPEGEYGHDDLKELPVARVVLSPGSADKDPLFSAILQRTSNKRSYDPRRPPSAAEIAALSGAPVGDEASLRVMSDPEERATIASICAEAMAIEVRAPARNVETAHWFRFNEREVEEKRDGFGVAQAGRGPVTRWLAENLILSRERAADPNGAFARGAVDQAGEQAHSSPAFGALTTRASGRRAELLAGRAYARVALIATSLGLAMHPMSQALEEYPEMGEAKSRLEKAVLGPTGGTVQMLFRLGHADAAPHTPRRDVRTMLRG